MESFLAEVTTAEWNAHQDAGRPWVDAVEILAAEHPEQRELIEAFHRRWPEMLVGEIPGTVDVLADLRAAGARLLALSNWSEEMFPFARERFEFLSWFEGIVISGEVGVNKPESADLRATHEAIPGRAHRSALHRRLAGERRRGEGCSAFYVVQFTDAAALRHELVRLELLPDLPAGRTAPRDLSTASSTRAPGLPSQAGIPWPAVNAEAMGASGSVSVSRCSSRARSRRSRSSWSWVSGGWPTMRAATRWPSSR